MSAVPPPERPARSTAAARVRAFVKACRLVGYADLLVRVDGAPLYLADLEALLGDDGGVYLDTRTAGADSRGRPW